jgi:hypothetical protein
MPRLDIVTDQEPTPDPPRVSDAPAGSVLARLRERAASRRRDQTLDVPIGGDVWGDELVIRYRMPPMEQADRLMATGARLVASDSGPTPSMSQAAVELMAACAVTVLGADENGRLVDLEVKLTGRLLDMLGLPLPPGVDDPKDATVTEVILRLFGDNWLAVNVHAAKVMGWLQGGGDEPGEASAAT